MFRTTRPLVHHLRLSPVSQPSTALTLHKQKLPAIWQVARFASSDKRDDPPPPKPQIDYEAERKVAQQKLQADPSSVTIDSTTRAKWDGGGPAQSGSSDEDVQVGLKHDIGIVKDAFRLSRIPRESHLLGLAGTTPYVATSLSTLYLSWDLAKELPTGSALLDSLFIDHDSARYLLSVIEPLQLGYGAVIISFLGAIHWGLEYAEKTTDSARTRFRYGMGVAASAAAWPTLLLPIEYGLTTQFMAFVALYFADSRAATLGWAPKWYGQYRFMLTAMVGLAIFISLVGRSQIEKSEKLGSGHLRSSMNRSGIADTETNWAKLEAEEKKKIKQEEEKKKKEEEKKQKEEEKKSKQGKKEGDKSKDEGQEKKDNKEKSEKKDEGDKKEGDDKKDDKKKDE